MGLWGELLVLNQIKKNKNKIFHLKLNPSNLFENNYTKFGDCLKALQLILNL